MRKITHIVIHCSATPEGRDIGAKTIRQWHLAKGWQDIGYHFVIRLSGRIEMGRDISVAGSHVSGHNANTIGVCMVGGLDAAGKKAEMTYTVQQWQALHDLVHDLKSQFPGAVVCGHRDFSPDLNKDGQITRNEWMKECPSFDAKRWWRRGDGSAGHNSNGVPLP